MAAMSKVLSAFVAIVVGLALVGSAIAQQSTTGAGTQPGTSGSSTSSGASGSSSGTPSSPSTSPSTSSPATSGTPSGTSSTGSAGMSSTAGATVDASSIIGATVRSNGKDVGKVSKLMLDPNEGRITTVIVGMGGMLGVGQSDISVPWSSVKIGRDGSRIVVEANQLPLEQAPSASPRDSDKSSSDKSKK
jgi:sporulation protein YlmC with PRC-barrel domain